VIGRSRLLLLLLAAGILFSVPAAMRDLWRPDEPRYAEVAREMMNSGDYLVPHVNGEVYREKPPLLFWLMAVASWPQGAVSAFTARVPSIAAALITVGLCFDLARRMFGERAGLWSAAILATTYRFWWQSNIGQIDMLLTACTTLSLYALWRWHEERRTLWALAYFAGAALGLFTKGPPALLIVALGAVVFLWGQRDLRRGLRLWIGLPLAIVPVLAWFLLARSAAGGVVSDEVSGTVSRQIVGRMFHGVTHPEAPWFYLINFPIEWLPWSFFAPWIVIHAWRTRREGPAMRLILAWTLPALIFFHLIVEKRQGYLLPLFPGFAILSARGLIALVDGGRVAWLRAAAYLCLPLSLAMAASPLLAPYVYLDGVENIRWVPIVLVGVASSLWTLVLIRAKAWGRWPMTLAAQMAAVLLAVAIGVYPALNVHKSAKDFCRPVRTLAHAGTVATYDVGALREELIFYTETQHSFLLSAPGLASLPATVAQSSLDRAAEVHALMLRACADVSIEDIGALMAGERASLVEARDQALAKAAMPGGAIPAYLAEVQREVDALLEALDASSPAVLLVQESDWRWILTFVLNTSRLSMLKHEDVSNRPMILLGNAAAVDALRDAGVSDSSLAFEQGVAVAGKDGGKRARPDDSIAGL